MSYSWETEWHVIESNVHFVLQFSQVKARRMGNIFVVVINTGFFVSFPCAWVGVILMCVVDSKIDTAH